MSTELRLGEAPFLAAAPYYTALDESFKRVVGPPKQLVELARAGKLDATPVPILDAFALSEQFEPVTTTSGDRFGMSAFGPMGSQLCYSRDLMDQWGRCKVIAPLESATPLRLMAWLAQRRGAQVTFVDANTPPSEAIGRLHVGDFALSERARRNKEGNKGEIPYDLAQEWKVETGLPMVFFLWIVRRDLPAADKAKIAAAISKSLEAGQKKFGEIARSWAGRIGLSAPELQEYLMTVRHRLGELEMKGMEAFRRAADEAKVEIGGGERQVTKVGFIGLGNMGGPMALNLVKAGHQVTVTDIRKEAGAMLVAAGAKWADTPAEAARGAELVLTSVPGPAEVEQAVLGKNGIIETIASGAIYADLSTSSVGLIRKIEDVMRPKGVSVLDAPVSGGTVGAQNATLQIMVGGDEKVFLKAKSTLRALGTQISLMGGVGAGTVAKLVHNLVIISTRIILAEGFTLGVKANVSAEAILEALRGGAFGQGGLLTHAMPNILKGDFDTVRFALRLARKDFGLATDLAREVNVPMPMATLAEQTLVEAMARGWGNRDFIAPFLLQEEKAQVTVRAKK